MDTRQGWTQWLTRRRRSRALFKYAAHKQGVNFDQIKVIDAGDVVAQDLSACLGSERRVHAVTTTSDNPVYER